MRNDAFGRFHAIMVAIGALVARGLPQDLALAQLGGYQSRGKGRGTPSRNFFRGNTSKYQPHQGKQEIARRLNRMNHGLSR